MAWQLIYTSASRLLEAGLTGFGTVARHRAIPPLVVKAVERISQFARLPGYDPGRIIFSHRILTVGGSRFHVLSRLRDAGSDYSGRTNHIAHHVIAPAAEIAQIGAAAVTPADVLLQMAWLGRWDRAPEWLESTEEITLPNFGPAPDADQAWAAVTGNPEHRWLLVNGPASKGCCLITPSRPSLLPLLAASQHCQTAAQSWQTGFTTALQPTDDLGDYRWMGVPADAPLRTVLESSGRPVLDLTAPNTLPEPEVPRSTSPSQARASRASSPPPPAVGKYTPPPPPHALSGINNPPSVSDGRKYTPLGGRRKQEKVSRSWVLALIVGVVVLAGIVAGWFFFENPTMDSADRAIRELELQIEGATTRGDIEKINSGAASSSKLGIFIEDVKRQLSSKPKSFQEGVAELKAYQERKIEPGIELYEKQVRRILERDAKERYKSSEASISDFEGYEWIEEELRKWAESAKKQLSQAATVNPPKHGDTASPPSKLTTETAQAKPTDPSSTTPPSAAPSIPPKAAVEKHAHISILKDWGSLEDLQLEAEWTEKMRVSSKDGPPLTLERKSGVFRQEETTNERSRFSLDDGRLKNVDNVNYLWVELINKKAGSTWRIYSIANGDPLTRDTPSKTPKASDALQWDKAAMFTITEAGWQNLNTYNLASGQKLVLACPFPIGETSPGLVEINISKKSADLSEEFERLTRASTVRDDDDNEIKQWKDKIAKAGITKANMLGTLKNSRAANYESDKNRYETDYKAVEDELKPKIEARKLKLQNEREKAKNHPLLKPTPGCPLPEKGSYEIYLKPYAKADRQAYLKLIKFDVE